MERRGSIDRVALVVSVALLPGVLAAREQSIPLGDIPERVLAAARREVPDFAPLEAELEVGKTGRAVYELEGLASGARYEVEILPDGTVVSVEAKRGRKKDRTGPGGTDVGAGVPTARTVHLPSPGAERGFVTEVEVLDLPVPESEIVTVFASGSGRGVAVVSPGLACGGEGEPSSVVIADLQDGSSMRGANLRTVDLGMGEATSVAAHPRGEYVLVAMKDPVLPNLRPGRVAIVAGARVLGRVPVGPGPDSIAVSRDGSFAVVACEASAPDPEECPEENSDADLPGSIHVLDLRHGPQAATVAAVVSGEDIFGRFLAGEPSRARDARDVEPEYVSLSPDSSYAIVGLQEQSAVVTLDLRGSLSGRGRSPVEVGRDILAGAVLLPHGELDAGGTPRGVHPDGLAISPDGSFAIAANEAHKGVRHLQGISVIDLRGGPARARLAATHSIFDLDPTLRGEGRPAAARHEKLPRIDPEGVTILDAGDRHVAAVTIERKAPGETVGSVLFLDLTGVLEGRRPLALDRRSVGANRGARPEGIAAALDGRAVFVATERDDGTLTRMGIHPGSLAP